MYGVNISKFKQGQNRRGLPSVTAAVIFGFIVSSTNLPAAPDPTPLEFNQDMLEAVADLYGISEYQAIDRLAKESAAALTLKHVKGLSLKSYAGSWFDGSSLRLNVAIADPEDAVYLKSLDVDKVYVKYSLKDLQDELSATTNQLSHIQNSDIAVVNSYIDYKSNKVALGVKQSYLDSIKAELNITESSDAIKVKEDNDVAVLSTSNVRGGDGTINDTWDGLPPSFTYPCSIGASTEDGYVTAGHCGEVDDEFNDVNGTSLSVMQGSTWFGANPTTDSAYAETVSGWMPTPKINGYSDGEFSVSAEWAGMVEFAIGSTVCRYGQTSSGPHCGTIDQINFTQILSGKTVTGLTRLSGSCSDDGDSGGPHVAGTGQIQGTNTGVIDYVGSEDCPDQAKYVFFFPIKGTLDEFGVTMLTSHGSSAPTITSVSCPNMAISGNGFYQCLVRKVDSQGEVGIQWTTSTGASSTGLWVSDDCNSLQMVTVTLKATNPYGTTTKNYSFLCPGGPIQ